MSPHEFYLQWKNKQITHHMILTSKQLVTLKEAAMPLMQWINDNCHPHCTAVVDSEHIELLEGLATARREPIREEVQG